MKKYPIKSNWISYKKGKNGKYVVHNHVLDDDAEMTSDEIELLERLNGEVNPYEILQREFCLTHSESINYVDRLTDAGILRQGNRVFGMMSMQTIVRICNSSKYRKFAIVLFGLMMIAFIPVMYVGYKATFVIFNNDDLINYQNPDGSIWIGVVLGLVLGIVFHEVSHAIVCCAFGGMVMEFGITFKGFPAAYTLLDYRKIPRMGQVITDLAGAVANLMTAALSMWILYYVGSYMTIFVMIASINLELALSNLMFIDGIDGCNAISKLLGPSDINEKCRKYLNNYKYNNEKRILSENDKVLSNVFRIFCIRKLIYPILILLNLCVIWGW